MISAPGMRSARSSERAVLPVAVGPQMTMSGGSNRSVEPGTDQRVRTGALDLHVHQLADELGRALEVDQLALAVAAGHARHLAPGVVAEWRADLIDQHLRRATDPTFIRLPPDLLLQVEQRLQSALLLRP